MNPPSTRSSSISTVPDSPPPSAKTVGFVPLSPQSSRTLRKLHEDHEQTERGVSEAAAEESPAPEADDQVTRRSRPPIRRHRSDSDPSADRPVVQRRRRRRDESPLSNDEEIEVLPARFDSAGRPLDAQDPRGWTSRQGDFEYRPQSRNGTHVRGAWGVGGTDPEMVNRMAQGVGNILEGRQGFLGLLGNVLSHLPGPSGGGRREALEDTRDEEDEDDGRRRRRHRRRRDDLD